jgi:hypothetical protein
LEFDFSDMPQKYPQPSSRRNKKRAKSFKELAPVPISVRWRLLEKIKITLEYQIVMVEAAGIE